MFGQQRYYQSVGINDKAVMLFEKCGDYKQALTLLLQMGTHAAMELVSTESWDHRIKPTSFMRRFYMIVLYFFHSSNLWHEALLLLICLGHLLGYQYGGQTTMWFVDQPTIGLFYGRTQWGYHEGTAVCVLPSYRIKKLWWSDQGGFSYSNSRAGKFCWNWNYDLPYTS